MVDWSILEGIRHYDVEFCFCFLNKLKTITKRMFFPCVAKINVINVVFLVVSLFVTFDFVCVLFKNLTHR